MEVHRALDFLLEGGSTFSAVVPVAGIESVACLQELRAGMDRRWTARSAAVVREALDKGGFYCFPIVLTRLPSAHDHRRQVMNVGDVKNLKIRPADRAGGDVVVGEPGAPPMSTDRQRAL